LASVTVHRGVDATDRADLIPREQWGELVEARRDYCRSAIIGDCRLILDFVKDAQTVEWLGHGTRDAYFRDGLGLDPDTVTWAERGLEIVGISKPVAMATAVDEGRKLASHGTNRFTDRGNNITSTKQRGTSSAYTLARLDRDAPELAADVRDGKLSAHAAAIEAGFRKKPTGIDRLRSAWKTATALERREFLKEVG